jgi:hypothetical protein
MGRLPTDDDEIEDRVLACVLVAESSPLHDEARQSAPVRGLLAVVYLRDNPVYHR